LNLKSKQGAANYREDRQMNSPAKMEEI